MADDNVKIVLSAEDRASAEIKKLQGHLEKLQRTFLGFNGNMKKMTAGLNGGSQTGENSTKSQDAAMRGLRQRWTFETRMNRQRASEERAISSEQARQDRARRTVEDRAMRDFNTRMGIQRRTIREQAGMERDAERARAAAARETIRLDNYRFGLRQRHERELARDRARADRETARDARASDRRRADVRRSVSRGFSESKDVSGRVVDVARSISLGGAIGAGALAKLSSIGLETRSRIDTAEANLRMFGGKSRDEVNAARSGWLNRSAVEYGFRPDKALNAFTEVLKAGIPEIAAKDVTRSIMGASAGLDLDVPDTTKLVGRLATLTQDPRKFDGGAIDKMLNGIAVVAKVTAADSKELVSSLRRGAGVLGSSKMSVQDLTAFTGVGISAGMQEGKAGTFMDFLVNDMVNAKTARGQRGKDLSEGFRLLGLGSNASVSRQTAQDPTAILLKLFEKMARMDPQRAARAANLIGMREWRGEMLMMAKASPMLRQTVEAERDPKNAGHLKQASDERLGTLAGLGSQLRATFDLAWESIGAGIEDIFREIGTFFVNLGKFTDFDVIKAHVHTLIDGFVDGLGFKNATEMLEAAFGKPGSMDYSTLKSFFEFAQGFGRGVRQVIDTIKAVVSSFTGTNMSADALGNLSAKVLGFSLAVAFAAPYFSVLAGLGTALIGFGMTVGTIATALRAAGLMGGAAVAPGAGAAAGGILGRLLGALKLAPAVAAPLSMDPSKADNDKLMGRLGRWAQEREKAGTGRGSSGTTGSWDAPATVQKQSANEDWRGLIHPASFNTAADVAGSVDRLNGSVRDMVAHFEKVAISSGGLGASISGGGSSGSGVSGGGGGSGSGRFFTPPDMSVPGWYGKGRGASGGGGSGPGIPDSVPMTADERNKLGLIMKYEGGGKNQMNYMGKRLGLDPNTAKGYTAQGYFQMLNSNWRRIAPKLGITTTNAMSSSLEDQTRVALHLLRNGGIQNWTNYNPQLRAALARGERAPAGALASIDPNMGVNVPGLGLGKGQYDGLRLKGDQARAGGGASLGVTDLARQAQENLPGGVKAFTAFNDRYHLGTRSKHAMGLAFDTTLNDAGLSRQAAEAMRAKLRAAGLQDSQFKVIDEYLNPSSRSTGGHIHTQFNDQAAAKQYHDFIGAQGTKAIASVKALGDKARRAQDGGTERLGAPQGGKVDVGGGLSGVPFGGKPSTDDIVRSVPAGGGGRFNGGVGGAGSGRPVQGGPVTINVHGAGENPQELANKVQRKMTEDWNHRTHDLEPELT